MRSTALRIPTRKRRLAALIASVTAIAALGLAGLPAASSASAATASDGHAPSRTVVSGDARFEVLSPTLIRTEYAGDARFTDGSTYNVVGRDSFAPTRFTRSVKKGWLTLDTGSMIVRYRVGSGAFTERNFEVSLRTDSGQRVTGSPWTTVATPECTVGVLCEAETLGLDGLSPATNHTGYTGASFVGGFENVGNSLTFALTAATSGTQDLDLRYANSQGGDGQVTTRTVTVTVDGTAPKTLSLPHGESWDDWLEATVPVDLTAGRHEIRVERLASDSGQVNVDSLAVVPTGSAYPAPAAASDGADCAFGAICQAEDSGRIGNAQVAHDHNGYAGAGFASGLWGQGSALVTHVTGVKKTGTYDVQVRYANDLAASPKLTVTSAPASESGARSTKGETTASGVLTPTSGWDYWNTVTVPVRLAKGANDITLGCPTEANNCNVNVDTLAVVAKGSPTLAPHAALGGYRRDLDTANGTVPTNPGLLFQDGWSLLDDTTSALYDPKTDTTTPRPGHGDEPYLDGYVFGYGNHYKTALGDLSTLTGPTKLLPRWAYGVWSSEYYDRTQAEFSALATKFEAEGVPVDVMAIDTDYKAPDKWNGWEVDTSRFPDMRALLAEWHSKGIHNTLNIHPTIAANDPRLPEAQAIAKGKLTKSGDQYLFDWSDPDQLKAYFALHDDLTSDGVDNYWLDWCCSENSKYSDNGVTPDSFINKEYADYTDAATKGSGFAFSRAYGSLTAGGYGNPQPVSTGPWADKRTTLHFTGDTTSSWAMLAAEVGYTPGESASTGLAAISHDIGGHNGAQYGIAGAEPGTTQLPPDLYARWVQFGTFQPVDRLHSNHSDRLPWQYPAAANASATKFLNLRENLVPLTYTLAAEATATGVPIVRPLYLEYPDQAQSYSLAGDEYLYGSDVLVAPVTTGSDTATSSASATTPVWFPAGSDWTDYFTGKTYRGGTTANVTTTLDSMPVFVKSGGIVPTRTNDVANDGSAPLDAVTLTVAGGKSGAFALHEDAGTSTSTGKGGTAGSATTSIRYTQGALGGRLDIGPAVGRFAGQVRDRSWTATFTNAAQPRTVLVDGRILPKSAWSYDAGTRTLTVPVADRSIAAKTTVQYLTRPVANPR